MDPFGSLMVATSYEVDDADALADLQDAESSLRGMSNSLGTFHQEILGEVPGWVNHDAGYDLECPDRQMLAEVKNKHNTMNAGNRRQVEASLGEAVRQKRGNWTGYLVIILPRRPQRYETAIEGQRNVYEIDGASFYHKATGDPNALHDLLDYLCDQLAPSAEVAEFCKEIGRQNLPPRV